MKISSLVFDSELDVYVSENGDAFSYDAQSGNYFRQDKAVFRDDGAGNLIQSQSPVIAASSNTYLILAASVAAFLLMKG